MIYRLLVSIATLLRGGLFDDAAAASRQIVIGGADNAPPAAMPFAALKPGEVSFILKAHDLDSRQTTVREFDQGLVIDVYAESVSVAERWSSLIAGTILVSQTSLLEDYNVGQPTQYATEDVQSVHRLDHIHLVGAKPAFAAKYAQWQIVFRITGHIACRAARPETDYLIQKILLASNEPAG